MTQAGALVMQVSWYSVQLSVLIHLLAVLTSSE